MINKRSWKEFQNNGMLWFVNMILHTFGWAITLEYNNDNEIIDVYPSRVKFRGFSDKVNTQGYINVSQYLKDNIDELLKESQE